MRGIILSIVAFVAMVVTNTPPTGAITKPVTVPDAIDKTGASDVSRQLDDFIGGLEDDTTVTMDGSARYRVDGTLIVRNKNGIVIDGNGASIVSSDPDRTGSIVLVDGGSHIVLRQLQIQGPHPNGGTSSDAYSPKREAQHGVQFQSATDVELDGMHISDVFGDFVYLGRTANHPSSAGTSRAWIHDSTFERNGRQGISLTDAQDVVIERNHIRNTRRATIDLEPNADADTVDNVHILNNSVG